MSYRCGSCNEVHYGTQLKHVVEVREVTYNQYYNRKSRDGHITQVPLDCSKGTEIVKEEALCPKCFDVIGGNAPVVSKPKELQVYKHRPKPVIDYNDKNVYNSFEDMADGFN